jgi:hypothetical protein
MKPALRQSKVQNANTLTDRNLEAETTISLIREPACFAFLCGDALSAPLPIDSLYLELASADWFAGRASLWATLEIRSGASKEKRVSVLGFDESFLRPFTRALIDAATTRTGHRMCIVAEAGGADRPRLVEYITRSGAALKEIVVTPHDNVVVIGASLADREGEETLFQLPRTDSFLRAFAGMAYQADQALRDTLTDMERIARRRTIALLSRPAP